MVMKSKQVDYWRDYFRSRNCDIFEVIEFSIMVAALDFPDEFRLRRDRIAEVLYSCRWSGCCDRVGSAASTEDVSEDGLKSISEPGESKGDGRGELRNYGYVEDEAMTDEVEALTDELEEEAQAVAEVSRIKKLLLNSKDESDSVIYESLRRLQLMELRVGTLKSTGIGKAVNHLRKHGSKQISNLAQSLISEWKIIVDEWFKTAPAAAPEPDCTPDSINPSIVDEEEGLPSPPLDEAFFASQTAPIELSQFFDGMDDYGNPRSSGEFIKNRGNNGRQTRPSHSNPMKPDDVNARHGMNRQQVGKNDDVPKLKKNINNVRPTNVEARVNREPRFQQARTNPGLIQNRQLGIRHEETKHSEEEDPKLEAAKRRLQESYQQVEKAKKQRTIQVMDFHELPRQSRGPSNPHLRHGRAQNMRFVNGRR